MIPSLPSPAPAHFWCPPFYKTYGPEVVDLCRHAGFVPDAHQAFGLDVIFARRDDDLSACFEVALVVGRQNMKSGLFKQCCLGWLFLFDERLIIYSAHEFVNAMEIFRDMEELVTGSDFLRRRVRRIVRNHGEESIETTSGARLLFKTRTKGGGRGLSGRKVILDEGFALRPMHMGALLPTLSAQPDPQVVYGSSAGMAESDVLRGIRDRGRAGGEPRLGYLEYCAPDPSVVCRAGFGCSHSLTAEGCGCDNPDNWIRSNPAIGGRITLSYVAAERRALPVSEFGRERMGWWDNPLEGVSPMDLSSWMGCADKDADIDSTSPVAIAFDVTPDSGWCSVAICGWKRIGERRVTVVEMADHLPGTSWVLERITSLVARHRPVVTVFDPSAQAGSLEQELRNRGFVHKSTDDTDPPKLMPGEKLMQLATRMDYAQACGALVNAVRDGEFIHLDEGPLNQAIRDSRAKPASKAWIWDTVPGGDISPLVAATLARLGLLTYGLKEPPTPFFLT